MRMYHNVTENERFQLLLRLRKLVELKYSDESVISHDKLDSQIINILEEIRLLEFYIF